MTFENYKTIFYKINVNSNKKNIAAFDMDYTIIKPKSNVLIVEDVITTGKSSLECVKLIKKSKAKLVGYACIIDRSDNKKVKIKKKIISQIKLNVPTYKSNKLPIFLKKIPITKPGSRFIK